MHQKRIIPCLLLKEGGLYKTIQFKNPVYVGDPVNAIRIFNEKEVDELIVLDIVASKRGVEPDYRMIENIASECFMPLCYGGGIKRLDQAKRLFDIGIEKICIQSAAIEDETVVHELVNMYGSQSVLLSVDVKKDMFNRYKLYLAKTGKKLKLPLLEYIEEFVQAGIGEIVLNSVDRDGTMAGMDLKLIQMVSQHISIPVIAMGGVGCLSDMKEAIKEGASAIGVGSFFVFQGPHRAVLITYPDADEMKTVFSA